MTMRRIFVCAFCSIASLDLLAQPQISMPYVQIGFVIVLYIKSLFSVDSSDFLPRSQYIYNSFTLSLIKRLSENDCDCSDVKPMEQSRDV